MRPVVQKAVSKVLRQSIEQGRLTWDEGFARLKKMKWEIGQAPWLATFSIDGKKMLTGKDFVNLLEDLLRCHLAPASRQAIKKARKDFRELHNKQYPVSEDDLAKRVKPIVTI